MSFGTNVPRRIVPWLCLAMCTLLCACASRPPRMPDPNAQVPPAEYPEPVKSRVSP